MGGRKRPTLTQMGRRQARQEAAPARGAATREKHTSSIFGPDTKDEMFLEELRKTRVVTPYAVASRYGIRLSIAKQMLKDLERRGFLDLIAASRYTRIYRVAS